MPAWHDAIGGEASKSSYTEERPGTSQRPVKGDACSTTARQAMKEQGFTDGPIVPATAGPDRPHLYHDNLQHHGGRGTAHGAFIGSISEIVYVGL